MTVLRQRDVINLGYDPYETHGTRSAVVIDGMKTPNHPNIGRIYSVITITKDPNNQYCQHDWTVQLPKDNTEADQPSLKHDSVITPWGTFNIQPSDVADRHTRLNDSGMKRIVLSFKRMVLDDVNTN